MSENGFKAKAGAFVNRIGLPTLIIGAFWIFLLILATFNNISGVTLISDTIRRVGMNAILVLAMVPAIQSGTGPNFALPLGILCGLFAMIFSIEIGLTSGVWLIVSIIFAVILATLVGTAYGKLLNAVKGSEMAIATYTGFSAVYFMSVVWIIIPFKNPKMGWMLGDGLRETIQLDSVGGSQILNNLLKFKFHNGQFLWGNAIPDACVKGCQHSELIIPTGLLLTVALFVFLVWLFFRSKKGIAISAGGINPIFARASGINHDKNRIFANILSTVIAAVGIIVYSQSYGYAQIYLGPLTMAFAAVAAILIGGASVQRAKVSHVIIGTILFQGLMTSSLPVANKLFAGTDLSETLRMIIQNGIILYALTQAKGGQKA